MACILNLHQIGDSISVFCVSCIVLYYNQLDSPFVLVPKPVVLCIYPPLFNEVITKNIDQT